MLSLFTTAKPCEGHSGVIQCNALKSWKLLHSEIEIILFGDDAGRAEIAKELGFRHDVEGAAEVEVFRGAERLLKERPPLILCENAR